MIIIPPEKLQASVLESILESYILREGTDYGLQEQSLAEKLDQLRPQVMKADVLIVFDEDSESLTLMTRSDYQEHEANGRSPEG